MSRPLKSKTGFYNLKLESSTLLHRQVMEASPRNSILARTCKARIHTCSHLPLGLPLRHLPYGHQGNHCKNFAGCMLCDSTIPTTPNLVKQALKVLWTLTRTSKPCFSYWQSFLLNICNKFSSNSFPGKRKDGGGNPKQEWMSFAIAASRKSVLNGMPRAVFCHLACASCLEPV